LNRQYSIPVYPDLGTIENEITAVKQMGRPPAIIILGFFLERFHESGVLNVAIFGLHTSGFPAFSLF